jgi:amidase
MAIAVQLVGEPNQDCLLSVAYGFLDRYYNVREPILPQQELYFSSIGVLSERLRRLEISPVDVVEMMLERIRNLNPRLNAYITVMAEQALDKATVARDELRRGLWRGPLHGVPVAVKDLCFTSDAPTSAGMRIHRNRVYDHDATVVDRLYHAGAIILGKLSLTEAAYTNNHPDFPTPVNPWNAEHWSGTSSSGSGVAAATGQCFAAIGTDTGGSIRFPSACNNLTGLKPTWGRVSRHGVFPLSESLDHIGPMARSVEDVAMMLRAIAGPDDRDPTSRRESVPDYLAATKAGISGLKIGIDREFNENGTHPEVVEAVNDARRVFQDIGARICPISFPSTREVVRAWFDICAAETATIHRETYPARASDYHQGMAGLIDHGIGVSGAEVGAAWIERLKFTGRVAKSFEDVDLLLVPTMITPTPELSELEAFGAGMSKLQEMNRYTSPFDMSGNPALVLPCGVSQKGVPISLQLIGKPMGEETLLAAGHAFQSATDWHLRRPVL